MCDLKKRLLCLLLAAALFVSWEQPVLGQGLRELDVRIREQREQERIEELEAVWEESVFASQKGITLSESGLWNGSGEGGGMKDAGAGDALGNGPLKNTKDITQETTGDFEAAKAPAASLRMPEPDAASGMERLYGEPVEVGRNHKTYQTSEGTYKTVFTSHANTYIENGEEKVIDNTLVSGNSAEGKAYTNKESDIDVSFLEKDAKGAGVSVSGNGVEALLKPLEGDYGKGAVSGNAIRYNGVFDRIDVQYAVEPNGVKQDIIILGRQERDAFTYRLEKDGIYAESEDNCIYVYGRKGDFCVSENHGADAAAKKSGRIGRDDAISGNVLKESPSIIISAPRMSDSEGAVSDGITLSLAETEEAYEITLQADKEWLESPERVYPVKIDPSVTVLKGEIDLFTITSMAGADRENINSFCGYFDGVGKARSYVITTFLYQSIGEGNKGVDVLSAYLDLYQLNDQTGFDMGCYRLNQSLYYDDITWDNSVGIDRYAAGEDSVKHAGEGWHRFDIRDSVSGWMNGIYESHGLVLISSDETYPGAVFATENYPDPAYTPTVTIEWQLSGDVPMDYSLSDTTINLRPMTLTTTEGRMQCYGVFADGLAKPYAMLKYGLSDESIGYGGLIPLLGNKKTFPDSAPFQSVFPEGTIRYKDVKSNWQTPVPFTDFDYDKIYSIHAQAGYLDKVGNKIKSDEFIIYRVSKYDTMRKIAEYYGVPLETLLFDNKAADMLLVENNTLFIRNPRRNQDAPYQPGELTDSEKAELDSALLGRALHCEFGFEPVNLNTGNYYLAQEDFSYSDSLGTFALQRAYNSLNPGRAGSFGRGFTSLFDESISAGEGGVLNYNREDGSSLVFTPEGNGVYKAPEGYRMELRREAAGILEAEFSEGVQAYTVYRYTVTEEDNSERTFDKDGSLVRIREENGETLVFDRDLEGRLTGITREGVTMAATTTPEGFISSITMPNGGVFRYGYDNKQNLTSVTDPMGNIKRFIYDENHRIMAWYDENGVRVVYNTYDSEGRVIGQTNETGGRISLVYENGKTVATDANGNRTVYEYDDAYRTTAIRYPDGSVEKRVYENGLLAKEIDRAGVETIFTYDGRGNIIKKEAAGIITSYGYDEKKHLTAVTDPCGNITRAEYDNAGNLKKLMNGEGYVTSFSYDGRNRLIRQTDAAGNILTYGYDGNCMTEARVNGRITDRYIYDAMGKVLSHSDGSGNATLYTYDLLSRNTSVRRPEGGITAISYGRTGLVESIRDARGGVAAYTYDKGNNITSITDALGNKYEYTYDANENRLSEKDPEGNVTSYSYDAMDRLIKKTDALGGIYTYGYDRHDNITSATDPMGNKQGLAYDVYYGNLTAHVDEEGIKTEYAYDNNGNLLSIIRDGILVAAYGYDKNGQNISTTLANGLTETCTYDGNGNCILKTDKKDRSIAFAYDDENRLVKETTALGTEYGYVYDKAGNLTTRIYPDGSRDAYTYDRDGNVLTWTDGEGSITRYAYDALGNLITETLPDGTSRHYAYDLLGRLISSADGRGYVTAYGYDKTGNLLKVTDPLNQTTFYGWDALSRNIKTTDVMGRTTFHTYDALGNLLSKTASDGGTTEYAYDKTGRLLQSTDALLRSTFYEYDVFGRIIKETDALGGTRRYEYDPMGNLTAFTDQLGGKTTYEYDLYGNIMSETDAKGNRTEYGYDVSDRLTKIRDAEGNEAELAYDAMGNLIRITDPLGAVQEYAYDRAGRLFKETAPDGGVTSYAYDKAGNLMEVTDSLLRTTSYSYDKEGNVTGITDPLGNQVSYVYDPLGRMISMSHEDGSKDLYAYDAAGNLTAVKESGVRITKYSYDEMDRLTGVEDALGKTTAYAYDLCGNLLSETAPDEAQTAYAYDELNRLVSRTLPNEGIYTYVYDKAGNITMVTGPTGLETAYEYDPAGNVTSLIRNKKQKTAYEYDSLDRISRITDAMGGKTVYTYDSAENLTGVTYADGGTYLYEYDKCGRVTGITDPAGLYRGLSYDTEGQLLTEETEAAAAQEPRITIYSYDENGNLTGVTDPLGGKTAYSYDERNRLVKTVLPMGAETSYEYDSLSDLTAVVDAKGVRNTYTYDVKGRLTGVNLSGKEQYAYAYDALDRVVAVSGEGSTVTYAYNSTGDLTGVTDANGETTAYEWDKAGNPTGITDPLGSHASSIYDSRGRLAESRDENGVTTEYDYDALDRLVRRESGDSLSDASYRYDAMGRLTAMEDVTGESLYTYDRAGRLLSVTNGNGETVSYHRDIYGNVTEVIYPDGRKVSYAYDACDRMTGVTTLEGKRTEYTYDADGNLTRAVREEGETRIAYDELGQIKGLINFHEGKIISAYGYLYDGRGNIIKEEVRIYLEKETVEQEYTYEYDGMSQLIRTELSQTTATAGDKKEKERVITSYVYDPAGNRLRMETKKDGSLSTVAYTYDKAGRLVKSEDSEKGETAYTYDGAGNLIREENTSMEGGARYYRYDAAGRLSAVTDQEDLLLAALYDGNGNRVFTMEYVPELEKKTAEKEPSGQDQDGGRRPQEGTGSANTDEEDTGSKTAGSVTAGTENEGSVNWSAGNGKGASGGRYAGGGTEREDGGGEPKTRETAALPGSGIEDKEEENKEEAAPGTGGEGKASGKGTGEKATGWKSFWYGLLCQAADILLPAPTPFKAWLHDKMGLTDSAGVLLQREVHEADLSVGNYSIREEGSPFALINNAVKASTGRELSGGAYRQVSYVNDVNFSNEQVLMERVINGSLGESTTGYSYGMWRESYSVETGIGSGISAGAGMDIARKSGSYYYTGRGSVANIVTGDVTKGYAYGPGGNAAAYGSENALALKAAGAECYGYNGEYTHQSLGLQYLRARYLKVETGTFTSRDSYAGRVRDILSQNRYTYAKNNPVTYADPDGHKVSLGNIIGNAFGAGRNTNTGRKPGNGIGGAIRNVVQSTVRAAAGAGNRVQNTLNNTGKNHSTSLTAAADRIITQSTGGMNNVLGAGKPSINDPSGGIAFAESIAARVEAARCQAYEHYNNDIQEEIIWGKSPSILFRADSEMTNGLHGWNHEYRIYYLNNLDGAKTLGHTAIFIVDADGNGDFYSYMGGIAKKINEGTDGYVAHIKMNHKETKEFLRTGNVVIEMPNERHNEDNYDRALWKQITKEEYDEVISRANSYEKNPPSYQIFNHNCDDVANEIIGNLGREVNMVETLPNNNFYVRIQTWDDWNYIAIGENNIGENILQIPTSVYYIWKGYTEKNE